MVVDKWIVASGPDWYLPTVSSTEQLMRQFNNDGYGVLWINPIAFKSPFVNSSSRSSVLRKIKNKIRTHLRWLRREAQGFWVLVPLYIPSFSARADRLNRWLIKVQIKFCCILLSINVRNSILWASGSFTAESILGWPFFRKVYESADLISGFRGASPALKQKLEQREKNLCFQATNVFAASEKIAEKLNLLCANKTKIKLLHHGVNYNHFSSRRSTADIMKKIKAKGKPIAGYFGSLSDANDKDVFLALAEQEFSVVIIGKVLGDYGELQQHENIYFLGPIPYPELPSYASAFDVGLLNWRMHEWILNCFPVKSLEYLAMGLPVVSCKIPVLMDHFANEMSFVETPAEFLTEARRLVAEDSLVLRENRRDAVRKWSWDSRYDYVRKILEL